MWFMNLAKSEIRSPKSERIPKLDNWFRVSFGIQHSALGFHALLQSLFHVCNNQTARLVGCQIRVIDDFGSQRNHQRRGGALTIALIARGEVFLYPIGGAAARTLLKLRIEVIFEIGLG